MLNSENINRSGRPKGSKNKSTETVRNSFQLLIQNNLEQLQSDLEEMTPKDRFNSIVSLAKFVLPTLNSIDFNTSNIDSFKPIEIYFSDDTNK